MGKVDVCVCRDSAQWDDLVRSSPAGTVFHESIWASGVTMVLASHNGQVLAGLPLAIASSAAARPHNIPYGGPIAPVGRQKHPERLRRAAQSALAHYVIERAPSACFCTSPWGDTLEAWVTAGFRLSLMYTSIVELSDLGATHSRFAGELRGNLRSAVRSGVTVQREAARKALQSLVLSTFARQGRTPWFDLARAVERLDALAAIGRGGAFVGRDGNGAPVAGVGIVWDNRRAYYVLGGRDPSRNCRGAQSLVLWSAMRYVREALGLAEFDLEGSERPGIATFFSQFGGLPRAYYHVRFCGVSIWDS